MHHICVMLAGENVASSPHICGELINFIKPTVDHVFYKILVAEIADHKVVSIRLAEAGDLRSVPRSQNPSCFKRRTK
jgi:hypothetical protein